ncbi:DUF1810 domain-containing protein [Elioraea sp.]|uniref:DUF1810 domain-containing protein n=1 Tax=Elioraea sp. TaxID=2185103 RepID=UPI0025BC7D02|nr:DUF1810 domain-containing protein [Elioraea sp.]
MSDAHDLARFVAAQAPMIDAVLAELRAGRKRTHWMWFVFPQLRGLGTSPMAERYGIASLAEARAYLAHPLLGPRLRECTEAVLDHAGTDLGVILGPVDALKFRSSMTLFAHAAIEDDGVFDRALDTFCEGRRDERTLALL